jgi:hypothetical protein
VSGSRNGDLILVLHSDDAVESITEELSSGSPSRRFSLLEHHWSFQVPGGSQIELHVEGFHSLSSDGDHFVFGFSADGVSFTPVALAELPSTDDDIDRVALLPSSLSGEVVVRVIDTNREPGTLALDTVRFDQIFVRIIP